MRGHRLVTVQPVITAADSKSEERATPKYNSYSVLYCADTPYYLAVLTHPTTSLSYNSYSVLYCADTPYYLAVLTHPTTSLSYNSYSVLYCADTPYYLAVLPPNTEFRGQHVSKRQIVKWE
ncbi:hypothetical protein EB796_002154 [Bugula neritina]|uniref:Uncharacterized protein n=1 Tax=Bugula neritina TaxID=10212 RepID=A0A7J7KMZ3_BUGNE|nr:hypothetical protein EB796_002154 [Bugula neritina]